MDSRPCWFLLGLCKVTFVEKTLWGLKSLLLPLWKSLSSLIDVKVKVCPSLGHARKARLKAWRGVGVRNCHYISYIKTIGQGTGGFMQVLPC